MVRDWEMKVDVEFHEGDFKNVHNFKNVTVAVAGGGPDYTAIYKDVSDNNQTFWKLSVVDIMK